MDLCLAQLVLYDVLMRLDQAFDPIPTPTVFFWQHSSDLSYMPAAALRVNAADMRWLAIPQRREPLTDPRQSVMLSRTPAG
jgi:hypothetical protein